MRSRDVALDEADVTAHLREVVARGEDHVGCVYGHGFDGSSPSSWSTIHRYVVEPMASAPTESSRKPW